MGIPFSVSVGTTTPVKLFTFNTADREIFMQNTDTNFNVWCSTFSAFTVTTGVARFALPKNFVGVTTNATFNIYCLADPSAGGSTVEIVGIRERNSKDLP